MPNRRMFKLDERFALKNKQTVNIKYKLKSM